jgi:membrane-bound lytic murein transglycosylase D
MRKFIVALLVYLMTTAQLPAYAGAETGAVLDDNGIEREILETAMHKEIGEVLNDCYHLFTKRMKKTFTAWLRNSQKYIGMIEGIFKEKGLPLELAYLPLIESGFSPYSISPAKAVGLWQFMEGTARQYQLRIDAHVDERRDPEKATRAAAEYLTDLYDIFGSWSLVLAAYNAGENRIIRIAGKSDDIFESKYMPDETKKYIPLFIAALTIARSPKIFGFDLEETDEDIYEYREVTVKRATGLHRLAGKYKTKVKAIKELNPALLTDFTPPYPYSIKIPVYRSGDSPDSTCRCEAPPCP